MKMSQIDTENDKNPETFHFSKILCIFSNNSTDFVNWNTVKRVNKVRMCCRVGFSEEFTAVFYVKMSQIHTDNDKKAKFSNFQSFYAFLLEFRQTSWFEIS